MRAVAAMIIVVLTGALMAPAKAVPGEAATGLGAAASIATGLYHTCVVTTDGRVRCWGSGANGRLGYGNTDTIGDDENPSAAGSIDLGGPAVALAAGTEHTCALMATGGVRCWGLGEHGRLGYGSTDDIGDDESPASVGDIDLGGTATAIAAGNRQTCALLSTGSLRCWGDAYQGGLGYGPDYSGDIGDNEVPAAAGDVPVGGTVTKIAMGWAGHTCAVLDGGAVRCWGNPGSGRLGYDDGSSGEVIGDNETPASVGDVPLGAPATAISAGYGHTCAILAAGAVRCWGRNADGQLGLGDTEAHGPTPADNPDVPLGGETALALGTGWQHTCALTAAGVRCWGWGANGLLGYGNTDTIGDDETPDTVGPIALGAAPLALSVGHHHACAVLDAGAVRCWGVGSVGRNGYPGIPAVGDDETPASLPAVDVGAQVNTADPEPPAAIVNDTPPEVSGTAQVGETLTASAGTWTPEPEAVTYQWLRDGTAIPGATAASYTLEPADESHEVAVRVTAEHPGHASASAESAPVVVDPGLFDHQGDEPTVPATAEIGTDVSASGLAGWWTPEPAQLTYQWLRNGAPVSDSAVLALTPGGFAVGDVVQLTVTAFRPGYVDDALVLPEVTVVAGDDPVPVPIVNDAPPVVSGTAQVGETLTASSGTWSPEPETVAYQWLRDGTAILGATAATYTLEPADEGDEVAVRVTAEHPDHASASAESAPVVVDPGLFGHQGDEPTVPATAEIGTDVAATGLAGWWTPEPAELTYQWLRNGAPVTDTATLTLTPADFAPGDVVQLTVTATRPGYADDALVLPQVVVVTDDPAPVAIVNQTPPLVSGTARVGESLTASAGTWSPEPETVAYQWLRDGTAILGATAATYLLEPADEGRELAVRVTAGHPDHESASATSSSVTVVDDDPAPVAIVNQTPPLVSGTARVGEALTASAGTWSPEPETVTYQWLRNGAAIPGAASAAYPLTPADLDTQVSVRVTAQRPGHASATATSQPRQIGPGLLVNRQDPAVTGSGRVGEPLTGAPGVWTPTLDDLRYQWLRGGAPIPGAASPSYRPVAADVGQAIALQVTAVRAGFGDRTAVSASLVVRPGLAPVFAKRKPKVKGTALVGRKLSAKKVRIHLFQPAPAALTYQWLRGKQPIAGATGKRYRLTAADRGKRIRVRVTTVLPGYEGAVVVTRKSPRVR